MVNIKCDNESVVVVCSTGRTKNKFLNVCLYKLLITAKYNIEFRMSHIKGVNNVVADALSRGKFRDLVKCSGRTCPMKFYVCHCRSRLPVVQLIEVSFNSCGNSDPISYQGSILKTVQAISCICDLTRS